MDDLIHFALPIAGYSVKRMVLADAEDLQRLYEQCTDYAVLEQGQPFATSAARDEFEVVPEGKTTHDKFIFGLLDTKHCLVGMIECIRHYPDEESWWLGLMMLASPQRGQGVGGKFYQAFERWVATQGAHYVCLAVLEENEIGQRFWQNQGFKETRRALPRQIGNKIHALRVMRHALTENI